MREKNQLNPTQPTKVNYKEYGFQQIKIKSVVRGQAVQSNTLVLITPTISNYDDAADPNGPIDSPAPGVDPIIDPEFFPPFPPTDLGAAPCSDIDEGDLPTISAVSCNSFEINNGDASVGCSRREILADGSTSIIAANKWDLSVTPRRNFEYDRGTGSINTDQVRATAYTFLNCDNVLNRPVIIIDGYEMMNGCGYDEITSNKRGRGRYNAFANELLDRGYDVIYLDVEFIGNYVENNGAVLRELIEKVNLEKANNARIYKVPVEQNVVVGYSLGGVISRYELALMETEGLNHDTRSFVSVDAPQKGANIPLAIQYLGREMDDMLLVLPSYIAVGGTIGQGLIGRPLWDRGQRWDMAVYRQGLDDHGAQQMLKYHIGFSTERPNPEYETLQFQFRRLGRLLGNTGYPTQCENIAIVNGDLEGRSTADDGNNRGLAGRAGQEFLTIRANPPNFLPLGNTTVRINAFFSPTQNATGSSPLLIGNITRYVSIGFTNIGFNLWNASYAGTGRAEYDLTSGGFIRVDSDEEIPGSLRWLYNMVTTYQPDHFTFIPSVSAADLTLDDIGNTHDDNFYLYYDFTGNTAGYRQIWDDNTFRVVDNTRTPFDFIYPTSSIRGPDRDFDFNNRPHGSTLGLRLDRVLTNHFRRVDDPCIVSNQNLVYDLVRRSNGCSFNISARMEVFYTDGKGCPATTQYVWRRDGNTLASTATPFYHFSHPESDIGNTFTAEVEIRKRVNPDSAWVVISTLSRDYRIDFVPRGANCPLKVRVENENEQEKPILLYPNPANTSITVASVESISSIQIINTLGQGLFYENQILKTKKTIDVSSLPKGIYSIKIESNNKLHILKFIKE